MSIRGYVLRVYLSDFACTAISASIPCDIGKGLRATIGTIGGPSIHFGGYVPPPPKKKIFLNNPTSIGLLIVL